MSTKQVTRRVGWLWPTVIGCIIFFPLGGLVGFFAFSRLETVTVPLDWQPEKAKPAPVWMYLVVLALLAPGLLFLLAKAVLS